MCVCVCACVCVCVNVVMYVFISGVRMYVQCRASYRHSRVLIEYPIVSMITREDGRPVHAVPAM